MSTVDEIKIAISNLTLEQKGEIARWFHGWDDDEWDEQMKSDIQSGKLDGLLKEVDDDVRAGRLRDMP